MQRKEIFLPSIVLEGLKQTGIACAMCQKQHWSVYHFCRLLNWIMTLMATEKPESEYTSLSSWSLQHFSGFILVAHNLLSKYVYKFWEVISPLNSTCR